jgi:gamma-glutamylcyclotransferase (GGCT)/AIG2-like uncharacterized protein YtfP
LARPRDFDQVFVYGTLRPCHAPPALRDLLRGASTLGEASVPGLLYDLGPYPAAVEAPHGSREPRIFGEVLRFLGPGSWLAELDAYEGFAPRSKETSLFVRALCTATLQSGHAVDCWIYLYRGRPSASARIASGRWEPSVLR